jgi:hypothetical protein
MPRDAEREHRINGGSDDGAHQAAATSGATVRCVTAPRDVDVVSPCVAVFDTAE